MAEKTYECECGNIELVVKMRECKNCKFNGYISPDPDGIFEWLYDEELRKNLEKEYNVEIERSQNYDNGSCMISDFVTNSCWTFECKQCNGNIVDSLPLMEC